MFGSNGELLSGSQLEMLRVLRQQQEQQHHHQQQQQQQPQRQHQQPLTMLHQQQGTGDIGGPGVAAVAGFNHMGAVGQLSRGSHSHAMSRAAAGLHSEGLAHSGLGRSMEDQASGLQALAEDEGMATAHAVRRGAASVAAASAAASAAHHSMATGAGTSPAHVSGLFAQDGVASQLLLRMARMPGGPGVRGAALGHLLRHLQPANGHSADGQDTAGDIDAGPADGHHLRRQQQQQQQQQLEQQQPRAWPPAVATRLGEGALLSAADAHDTLAALRSRRRSDADADMEPDKGGPHLMSHAWEQHQRQLRSMEVDHRRGLAVGTSFHSRTEDLAIGVRAHRHTGGLLGRVSVTAGRDAALASGQDEVHVQGAAQARPSSVPAVQPWPRKRASGSGLEMGQHGEGVIAVGGAQAGASAPREQQRAHSSAAADHDSDVEEVPPPQHTAVGHENAPRRLHEPGVGTGAASEWRPPVWSGEPSVLTEQLRKAVPFLLAAGKRFEPMAAKVLQQIRDRRLQPEQSGQKPMPSTHELQQQQQQQKQQHILQHHADAESDQAGPDRRRGSLDRTPPRKLQATQRSVPTTAQPDSAPQQRTQMPAPIRWHGQGAKQPVITQGRGVVVTARSDQPRLVTNKLPPQTRVLPGSGRTPPPVIRPGPGLPVPACGPLRGSVLAPSAATVAPTQLHQPAAAVAVRLSASVLPADAVVLSDVDVLLTTIGGLLTRAPVRGHGCMGQRAYSVGGWKGLTPKQFVSIWCRYSPALYHCLFARRHMALSASQRCWGCMPNCAYAAELR